MVKAGSLIKRLLQIIHVRDDGGLDQGGSGAGGEEGVRF